MAGRTQLFIRIGRIVGIGQPGWYGGNRWSFGTVANAYMLVRDGRICRIGTMDTLMQSLLVEADEIIDLGGRWVLPGFCDAHTHLLFPATREEEWLMRLRGYTYQEIARRGGGILASAQRFAESSDEALIEGVLARLDHLVRMGTTAVEIKTGYGLTVDQEIRAVRLLARVREQTRLTVRITVQALHALPVEYRDARQRYIRAVCEELLPAVRDYVDFCDVFCEEGFFTPEESLEVLERAVQLGMRVKVHAHQFGRTGGIEVARAVQAVSVDHLEHLDEEDLVVLRSWRTMPVVLPGSSFFLRKPFSPARRLLDSGLPVALASDWNPGTAPSGNLYFIWHLACAYMGMTPEEAFTGLTVHGAVAMDIEGGALYEGGVATFQVVEPVQSLAVYPYEFGHIPVRQVYIGGERVV